MGLFDFFRKKGKPTSNGTPSATELLEEVEVTPGICLPKALAPYWKEIEKTKLPYVSIKAMPKIPSDVQESSFGYYPCLPKGYPYPVDAQGNYMYPLAQINCNHLPALDSYPRSGYLQFYIATDDIYGLNFDNQQEQKGFRVLYSTNEEVNDCQSDFSFLEETMNYADKPVRKPHNLEFTLADEYLGLVDVRYMDNGFFNLDEVAGLFPSIAEKLEEYVWDHFDSSGHKIGGYANFTQEDPRHNENEDYILLLQIDSDKEIMWGDSGVANFFIHPDDLAVKDFSRVMYNWDCS